MAPSTSSQQQETLEIQRISASNGWRVVDSTGSAEVFHHTAPLDNPPASVWIHQIPGPALVLGSGQPEELIDRRRATRDGIEVCRRRSGGGLVYIDPVTDCWLDVIIPSDSSLWSSDVGTAFHWVGDAWARLLTGSITGSITGPITGSGPDPGNSEITVTKHSNRTPLGQVWCFGDLGHGEVAVNGAKVLGLSQRRTRTWARIQCLVLGAWDGDKLRSYVDLQWLVRHDPERFPTVVDLDPGLVHAGPPPPFTLGAPAELAHDFVAAIPKPDRPTGR